MKKALLVVSFGTSYHDTREKNIAACERDLAANIPRQLLAGGGRHRQGVAHAGGVQLLADRPRIAGAPDNQHVAVVHSA